nr:MAG TPA: hypothetical protein [Caudoviricetes sp.]
MACMERLVIYHGYRGNDLRTVALAESYQLGCACHQM